MSDNNSELMGAFNAFKQTFEGKQDALTKEVQTKTADAISKALEGQQALETQLKAVEQKAAAIETAVNRVVTSSAVEADEVKSGLQTAIKSWIVDGANTSLDEYLKDQKFESKALREAVDSDGGYLIRADFGGVINTRVFDTSPLRTVASVFAINSNAFEFIADEDEADVSATTEEGSRSNTGTPALRMRRIPVHEIYAQAPVTKALLQDYPAVDSWLANKIGDKIGRTENESFVNGNTPTEARGFTTYSAWASAGTFETGKIEQVNSTSSGAFTFNGLLKLMGALNEEYQSNAVFAFKRQTFYTDVMSLKDSQNRPIFNIIMENNLPTMTVLGKRVLLLNDMAATGADALAGAYGDFGRGYYIVDRLGIDLIRDPYSAKPNILFYATKRTGGDVANFQAIKLQKLAA